MAKISAGGGGAGRIKRNDSGMGEWGVGSWELGVGGGAMRDDERCGSDVGASG